MRQLGSWPAYVSGAVAMALVASVGSGVAPTRVAPAASAAPTIPVIEDTGEPERQLVPELTTETSVTYQEPDGSRTLEASAMPINFRDEAGEWQPIDTELVASPGDRWAVENAAAAFEAKLPEDAAVDPVRFATDDGWVTVSMEGATGDPVVDDSSATYAATGAADAVEYQALNTGLKETVVLDDLPATAPVLEFSVETSAGLTPRLNDANEIEFVNAAEEVVFHTPAGWMSDSAEVPEESSDVAYDLEQTDTGWGLTVTPDWAWLSDPARMYPVRIDPTVMNPPRTWWGTAGSRKPPPVRSTARRPTR